MNAAYIVSCVLFGLIANTNALRLAEAFEPENALDKVMDIESDIDPHEAMDIGSDTHIASSWEVDMQQLRKVNNSAFAFDRSSFGSSKTKRLAVLIAGLQDRALLASKVKNVMHKAAAQGYTVDLYMSLVKGGVVPRNHTNFLVPNTVDSQESSDESVIRSAIAGAGAGSLMSYNLLDHQLDIHVPADHPKRMTQYFDCRQKDCPKPWGKNVLRKYRALEGLFNQTLASGFKYDFFLVTKDDDEWLGPLNITAFESAHDSSNKLFTKKCLTWGGINDKTLMLGGDAAKKVLGTIYTHFFDDTDPSLTTRNVELFLKRFAQKQGVVLQGMPFGLLPTADSVYIQKESEPPQLCQKKFYLCPGLPRSSEFKDPIACQK